VRVLHVVTAFPRDDADLITPWLGQLLLAQREAGWEPSVLAPAYRGGGAVSWRGVPVRRFRYAPRALETLTHDQTVPDRVRSRPLYAALLPGYLLGGVIGAVRAASSRPDIVHVHWPFPHALFGAVTRSMSGGATALVSSFYSVEISWVESRLPFLLPALRWSIETSDGVTAISTATASAVRRHSDRTVEVIPFAAALGDDLEAMSAGRSARDADGPLGILFVGRLVERKGVEVLVRALAILRQRVDARLTVVGAGPREESIRRTVAAEGLEEVVRLTGAVGPEALVAAYGAADVFVRPAVIDAKGDTEGLGVVLLEALHCGLPVVASDVGGIPDVVRDGTTGWLVPPGDPAALAAALLAVASDPAEAARRASLGRRHAIARFSLSGIVDRLGRCYRRALDHRRRRNGPAAAESARG